MQGGIHGVALLSCTCAPKSPVTASVHQSARSPAERSVFFSSSGSYFSLLDEDIVKLSGERSCKKRSSEFGSKKSRFQYPMSMIGNEAAAGSSWNVVMDHSQNLALRNDYQMSPETFETSSMFVVVGHRGCGKNKVLPQGSTPETRLSIRENTITSFNLASKNDADLVEFDVQVTKDGIPIIFHDDVIIAEDQIPRHIREITLEEFRGMGPQTESTKVSKSLYRKAVDGSIVLWTTDVEDSMCILAEAFSEVQPSTGFNIELKFDDDGSTTVEELHRVIDAVLQDVGERANGRMIYFSSFHPDAVQILRKKMSLYPVFFLTKGGSQTYNDPRRNSIEAAIEVCREGNLQGIVSEVKAVLQHPASVALVKSQGLFFFTYGDLNNIGEAVLKQKSWGIDGVIVDHVLEMVRVARQQEEPASSSSASPGRTVPVMF